MSQTTLLANEQKVASQAPAQVIALDPRSNEHVTSSKKYLRILQLSDLLSRNLEIGQVIEAFMTEISTTTKFCGYRFSCDELDAVIEQGVMDGFSVNYRLTLQNRPLGEVTLFKQKIFNGREVCDLEDLLCSLIYPIKNALLYQVALKSAYRDPLTGLNNRAAMEKFLPREIDLAKRHKQSMALLVMDLDGFKQINDVCGHDAGDQVLRKVGEVISEEVRHTDLVYRYGGDEFVGGLGQTDLNGAIDVSERIRNSIEKMDFADNSISLRVKISIGITLVRHSDSFSSAFKRADKALYQAKMNGKNQIIIC